MTEATQTPVADRELVLERVIDAPRALVFRAYTDPQHLPNWFGPKGFTCETHAIDIREGGHWHFTMKGPDGKDWPNYMAYTEVTPNERLRMDHGATPEGGPHFQVTITFEDLGVRTKVTQRSLFPTKEAVDHVKGFGAVELGYQTLDKLAARVATMGLRITRTVDAPRDLVFAAWTQPERLVKWWGPVGMDLEVVSLDVRPGGNFLYRMHKGENEMWGQFRYLEVDGPGRLVYVSSFSDKDGGLTRAPFGGIAADYPLEVYNLMTLTEVDGKTVLELGSGPLNASPAETACYHGMNESMQQGFAATFKQLEDYLAGLG